MKNVFLIVDLEEQYLTDDDYMGLISYEYWDETREELKEEYTRIINIANKLKNEGWEIHFTGKTNPYGLLNDIADVILPYWEDNKEGIRNYYHNQDFNITVGGIFYERCVNAVSKIVKGSYLSKECSISHYFIGDEEGYFADYEY